MKKTKELFLTGYKLLFARYGEQHWWPGDTPWEICAGAILTQNTNWRNVELAIAQLKQQKALDPCRILDMPDEQLEQAIRSAGFFRLKRKRLRAIARWWLDNSNKIMVDSQGADVWKWRNALMEVNGVGDETADSILLYCFNLPVFVIDAYTKRAAVRHFGIAPDITYHELQKLFMENLPSEVKLYNEYHALLVRNAKECCRKRICEKDCPLRDS